MAGCIIPLPYDDPEGDAGVNFPPVIRSVTPAELGMPGPVDLDVCTPLPITLDIEDKDSADVLYLRVFRNYSPSTPNVKNDLEVVNDGAAANTVRPVLIDTAGWCLDVPTGSFLFEVVVTDRDFAPIDQPPQYRKVDTANGAEWSEGAWIVNCFASNDPCP